MPPKVKVKNAPNQHDKRHENGLAPPGRRITKQRSSGQLNGQSNGKPVSNHSVTPPALPTTGLNQGVRFPRSSDPLAPHSDSVLPTTICKDNAAAQEIATRDRTSSDVSEEGGAIVCEMADLEGVSPPSVAVYSAEQSTILGTTHGYSQGGRSHPSHPAGPFSSVSTILAYYPLRDAIAILILLLSLPPTLVLIIQTLFASLTFVPPTAGITFTSLLNFKELFSASNLGYPAMATILIVDLIFWVCWLPVWKPLQNVFLDLSQAVIAVSLSGAAASTGGPTYSIATCTLIVGALHVFRYKAIHQATFDYLRYASHKMGIGLQVDMPSFASAFAQPSSLDRGWVFTVIRTMLGIHIVSQGITTCIRRSLVQANERDQNPHISNRVDPEATAGSDLGSRPAPDPSHVTPTASMPESRPPPSPAGRDMRAARESNSKKKKKQANQARSQQPLWAAIASTKVTFVKEMEQRDYADDARDASVMDVSHENSPPVSISTHWDRIWISDVRATDIFFGLDLSADAAKESIHDAKDPNLLTASVDKSKPFYVRINGAMWSSARIMSSATGEQSDCQDGGRYDGEIFGLAPLSTYKCEIVGIATGHVWCWTNVITGAPPTAEQTAAAPIPPQHSALRPSSPISTLRQSILSAESKLNETRNRTRKSKRDQRGIHADIRKEINALRSKMESSGGNDDRQERRLIQINQHKMQAEEAIAELKQQIDDLGDIPAPDLAASDARKRTWKAARDAKTAALRELEAAKAEADRELGSSKAELSSAESKREKLSARNSQKIQELEKLMAKHQADMSARQERETERARLTRERQGEEAQMRYHINSMESETLSIQQKTQEAYHQIAALQSWATHPPPAYPGYSSPPTPESVLPGNMPSGPSQNGFGGMNMPVFSSHFPPSHQGPTPNPQGQRGRSSSMLSQYSGFTDDLDNPEAAPFHGPQHVASWPSQLPASSQAAPLADDRSNSDGSETYTNGSAASNSPRPDARSFVPGMKMGPIGPPSKLKAGGAHGSNSPGISPGVVGSGR